MLGGGCQGEGIAGIAGVAELNIGHTIVARAIMVGFERAVREMKMLVSGEQ